MELTPKFGKACNQVCPNNTLYGCKKDELNNGVCVLSNFVAAQKVEPSGWISVKDRLPEKKAICINNYNDIIIGHVVWDNEQGWYEAEFQGVFLANVTHWKPLPEPPKEVE